MSNHGDESLARAPRPYHPSPRLTCTAACSGSCSCSTRLCSRMGRMLEDTNTAFAKYTRSPAAGPGPVIPCGAGGGIRPLQRGRGAQAQVWPVRWGGRQPGAAVLLGKHVVADPLVRSLAGLHPPGLAALHRSHWRDTCQLAHPPAHAHNGVGSVQAHGGVQPVPQAGPQVQVAAAVQQPEGERRGGEGRQAPDRQHDLPMRQGGHSGEHAAQHLHGRSGWRVGAGSAQACRSKGQHAAQRRIPPGLPKAAQQALKLASMQCSVDSAVARLDSLCRYRASAPLRAAIVQACGAHVGARSGGGANGGQWRWRRHRPRLQLPRSPCRPALQAPKQDVEAAGRTLQAAAWAGRSSSCVPSLRAPARGRC